MRHLCKHHTGGTYYDAVFRRTDLNGNEKVLYSLFLRWDDSVQSGAWHDIHVSHRHICAESGLTLATAKRALKRLRDKGLVMWEAQDEYKTNRYTVHRMDGTAPCADCVDEGEPDEHPVMTFFRVLHTKWSGNGVCPQVDEEKLRWACDAMDTYAGSNGKKVWDAVRTTMSNFYHDPYAKDRRWPFGLFVSNLPTYISPGQAYFDGISKRESEDEWRRDLIERVNA